ncbi:MAG: type II secretion system F family protein [Acidimicrobiales bacterium]
MAHTKYKYTAIDKLGNTVSGMLSASTAGVARLEISSLGLQPVAIEQRKTLLDFELTRKKVKAQLVMAFSRQLGVFIRSGIPIIDALEIIENDTTDKLFKKTLAEMSTSLQGGESFARTARGHPEAFPLYFVGMLESAELSGNLDSVLVQLADYMERDLEAKKKITSALIYPMIVLCMAIVVVVILATFVLPKFKTFFSQLNAKLPLVTRMLLAITNFISGHYAVLLGAIAAIIIAFVATFRSKRGRALLDSVVLKIPVAGDLVVHILVERICRILASMSETGVPLPDAMEVTSQSVSNDVFKKGLEHVRAEMIEGRGLAEPVESSGIFPLAARQMIRVGEVTGTLEDQLQVAADYYERELDFKLKKFTALFEPIIIVVMGVIVGFVAIALISAMYGIYRQVNVSSG